MTSKSLSYILRALDLNKCTCVVDKKIYYIKKAVKIKYESDGKTKYNISEYEFLVLTNDKQKQGIILKCSDLDLHWYVFKKYRNQKVLSNALRTGVINKVWPENKKITCCYEVEDFGSNKYELTKHLAEIADLELVN